MKNYWNKGVSYETYKTDAENRISNPRNEEDVAKK